MLLWQTKYHIGSQGKFANIDDVLLDLKLF